MRRGNAFTHAARRQQNDKNSVKTRCRMASVRTTEHGRSLTYLTATASGGGVGGGAEGGSALGPSPPESCRAPWLGVSQFQVHGIYLVVNMEARHFFQNLLLPQQPVLRDGEGMTPSINIIFPSLSTSDSFSSPNQTIAQPKTNSILCSPP